MSRGLGKVEKKILEFLNDEEITKDMGHEFRLVPGIVEYVYYEKGIKFPDLVKENGAPYQSVCRTLRRMEQKGLIKSKWKDMWDAYYDKYGAEKGKYYRFKVIYPVKSKS